MRHCPRTGRRADKTGEPGDRPATGVETRGTPRTRARLPWLDHRAGMRGNLRRAPMSILMSSGAPWCALLLACTLGTATPGSAQPTPPTAVTALDPIVVTAARMP